MDPIGTLILTLVILAFSFLILYFIIKGAVHAGTLEALKDHTRWVTAHRDAIEEKYAKKP